MDEIKSVNLPESLIEEAKLVTGKRSPRAAFKALVELRHVPKLVREPEREFLRGKGKRFSSARKALAWLES